MPECCGDHVSVHRPQYENLRYRPPAADERSMLTKNSCTVASAAPSAAVRVSSTVLSPRTAILSPPHEKTFRHQQESSPVRHSPKSRLPTTLFPQRMIKPYGHRSGLEHHAFCGGCLLANQLGSNLWVGGAPAAPDPLAFTADRYGRLFHRHVETDIFFHGCSPFDAWARRPVVSPQFHPFVEQPPSKNMIGPRAARSRDYRMWISSRRVDFRPVHINNGKHSFYIRNYW